MARPTLILFGARFVPEIKMKFLAAQHSVAPLKNQQCLSLTEQTLLRSIRLVFHMFLYSNTAIQRILTLSFSGFTKLSHHGCVDVVLYEFLLFF